MNLFPGNGWIDLYMEGTIQLNRVFMKRENRGLETNEIFDTLVAFNGTNWRTESEIAEVQSRWDARRLSRSTSPSTTQARSARL